MTSQPWHVYRCVDCHGQLDASGINDGAGEAICTGCDARYPVTHGVIDTLIRPSEAVVDELRGLAAEREMAPDRWEEVKLEKIDHVPTLEERLAASASEPVQYYQQTTASFDQLMAKIEVSRDARVLEIGVHAPFYFLERFREVGAECFALNILFFYEEPDPFEEWPHKALGDMNELPYDDGTFDVVLVSATAHHSSSLGPLFSEVARVLVPGGRALVINEPVEGLLKRLGSRRVHGRDEHIHEGAYRVWEYGEAMRAAGFRWTSHFPDFFDRKLRNGDLHPDTRFSGLARSVSRVWQIEPLRSVASSRLLWPAQAVLGLPLNAVLTKGDGDARSKE